MKDVLQKAIHLINAIAEKSNDSELEDYLDEAVLALEAASDRLIAIEEELDAAADEAEALTQQWAEERANVYYCVSCHQVPVNPQEGEDTCSDCLSNI